MFIPHLWGWICSNGAALNEISFLKRSYIVSLELFVVSLLFGAVGISGEHMVHF